MAPEKDAQTFSPEEQANVSISCALSATAFEFMPNITSILSNKSAKQQRIKLFEVLASIAIHQAEFLRSANRFIELVTP